MDCKAPQSCSDIIECPGPSNPKILSPENCGLVSGIALDGRDGLLGCLLHYHLLYARNRVH